MLTEQCSLCLLTPWLSQQVLWTMRRLLEPEVLQASEGGVWQLLAAWAAPGDGLRASALALVDNGWRVFREC